MSTKSTKWHRFTPSIMNDSANFILKEFVTAIVKISDLSTDGQINKLLTDSENALKILEMEPEEKFDLLKASAALKILRDLRLQGWEMRLTCDAEIEVRIPESGGGEVLAEKERIRKQELLKRNEQLREPSIRRFIQEMERGVIYQNRRISIFSLLRDGRELAQSLREARVSIAEEKEAKLSEVVKPFLQFVDEKTRCSETGFRLQDIWRYFRHTWTNYYTSTPGRTLSFIVRDKAREFYPVIGIGAIGSSIVQLKDRDSWLGWQAEEFLDYAKTESSPSLGNWLLDSVERAISETYLNDFFEEDIEGSPLLTKQQLVSPTDEVVDRLCRYGESQRVLHHRFVNRSEFKTVVKEGAQYNWESRTLSHLFKSKRAILLAEMLRSRKVLSQYLSSEPNCLDVQGLLQSPEGRSVVKRILRKVKSERVGVSIADITVCGAVDPYRSILGGKLISLLAASPAIVNAYQRRYSNQPSEIASSMAGRPIYRSADLVFLGTTSLYGVGSSQYNRIKMPAEILGGRPHEQLSYLNLGKSYAYGTSHFSSESLRNIEQLVNQSKNGIRVNSIFGEGVSPKLRKIREGFDLLGINSDNLLQHGRHRIIYGVPLIRNLREFLLGFESKPDYIFNNLNAEESVDLISSWWVKRWLSMRVESDEVLQQVSSHTLVYPIRHGARVVLPPTEELQGSLFEDENY